MSAIFTLFRDAEGTMERKLVEAGAGMIQWITQVFPQLRPYICYFYKMLASPHPKSETWTRKTLEDKMAIMNDKCQFIARDTGRTNLQDIQDLQA